MGRKSGPRWWTIGSARAARTCGGTGVGPGVIRYCLPAISRPEYKLSILRRMLRRFLGAAAAFLVLAGPAQGATSPLVEVLDGQGRIAAQGASGPFAYPRTGRRSTSARRLRP